MDRFGGLDTDDRWLADDRGHLDPNGADMADMTVDDNSTPDIGSDERRMHVRAYNHWVSLLGGRAYPAIEDLDPENIADFGPHSVLLDFTGGIEDPAIRFLGSALREACALDESIVRISQVPGRSLLSRLTDHYLQIIANRAPIGFEAEFVSTRGLNTLYRGILMPFSSDNDTIDFIYGVINWKELVDAATQAALDAEVAAAVRAAPRAPARPAAWADGPSADFAADPAPIIPQADAMHDAASEDAPIEPSTRNYRAMPLADQLMLAQQSAAVVHTADLRSRAALYRALSRAYDFALATRDDPAGYQRLLDDAGIAVQARAPMTPVVKLVFGVGYDKTRLTEFATVLDHARSSGVVAGGLSSWLDTVDGGIKGVVRLARAERRPATKPTPMARVRDVIALRPSIAQVPVATSAAPGEFVLLVGRAGAGGAVDIVAAVEGNQALTDRALRHIAG